MTKTAAEVARVLEQHFKTTGRSPRLAQSDSGGEFCGEAVQRVLRRHGVAFRALQNKGKACMAENANLRLKTILYQHMTHTNSWRWLEALRKIVHTFNQTPHSVTGCAPAHVTPFQAYDIWSKNYLRRRQGAIMPKRQRLARRQKRFKLGDFVRISLIKTNFQKGYLPRYSEEIYRVKHILRMQPCIMYRLVDLQNRPLKGNFYSEELISTATPTRDTVYRVEEVLQRRQLKGKQPEVLVKWSGYDKTFNSWILESELRDV